MRHPNPRRLINQLSKAMERKPQDVLHRVRTQPAERVDKFKREPPRGPARPNGPRHNPNMPTGLLPNNRHQGGRMNGRPGFGPPMPNNVSPQQQMAFYQMYQQQSQMIAPYNNGPQQTAPGFPGPPRPGMNHRGMPQGPGMTGEDAYSNNLSQPQRAGGGSLFDRIQAPPDMSTREVSVMEAEGTEDSWNGSHKSDSKLEEVPCKFGTGCTKAECPFGHPTPATPAGRPTQYINGEKCPFGIGCKNKKCTGSHPSPASIPGHYGGRPKQVEADCKFFPNCTNPNCPFKQSVPPVFVITGLC